MEWRSLAKPLFSHLSLSCTSPFDEEEKVSLVYDRSTSTEKTSLTVIIANCNPPSTSHLPLPPSANLFVCTPPNLAEQWSAFSHICLSDCTIQGGGVSQCLRFLRFNSRGQQQPSVVSISRSDFTSDWVTLSFEPVRDKQDKTCFVCRWCVVLSQQIPIQQITASAITVGLLLVLVLFCS